MAIAFALVAASCGPHEQLDQAVRLLVTIIYGTATLVGGVLIGVGLSVARRTRERREHPAGAIICGLTCAVAAAIAGFIAYEVVLDREPWLAIAYWWTLALALTAVAIADIAAALRYR